MTLGYGLSHFGRVEEYKLVGIGNELKKIIAGIPVLELRND